MCGISVLLDVTHSQAAEELRNIAQRIADSLLIRGPK